MEYCHGGSLHEYMNNQIRGLEEEEIKAVVYQVLHALAYLHKDRILHRDVKAANILMEGDLAKLGKERKK